MWHPYEITAKHQHTYNTPRETDAICSTSAKGHVNPYLNSKPMDYGTYREDVLWKPYSKVEPMRTGTLLGARRHNPQPSEDFLDWKLPRGEKVKPSKSLPPWAQPFSKQKIREASGPKSISSYDTNYLGLPQGSATSAHSDLKILIPKPTETEFRCHYQPPAQACELMGLSQEKGCNAKQYAPKKGLVPTVTFTHTQKHENTKQLATYQSDFGKDYFSIISILNSLDPEQVNKYVENAPEQEKMILQNFLNTVNENQNEQIRKPSPLKRPPADKVTECKLYQTMQWEKDLQC
ncbi:testis-expressed protein 26 [Alligator mississippiensis]|uniref:testis-expressed protein 26 n=1 Tax=Alligator mississippiensis TaxID=8496 RepID=UPI00090760B3|nr:testis-expressed protein 26 [Alligator mississippiensis]